MNFLQEVASIYLSNHIDEIGDYCFVFPNRRSSVFFKKYLTECSDKTLFSPTIKTIQELFTDLSGLITMDKTRALYELYLIYISKSGSKEGFDDFINWGDVILNDFDDIDKYLIDSRDLYSNIKDLKEIDSGFDYLSDNQIEAIRHFWENFLPYRDREKEEFFLSLWTILYDIYNEFRATLIKDGYGYEGMLYRAVAEAIRKGESDPGSSLGYKRVIFVGLNVPNECEKVLLSELQKRDKADFYWDYFGEILTDKSNKSSLFMGENIQNFPSRYQLTKSSLVNEREKKIEVISVPSAVGQSRTVSRILESLEADKTISNDSFNTAIVLPDERLLQPVLNSIPEFIDKINVTMGYPLSYSAINSVMNRVASLQMRAKITSSGESLFYHNDVISILDHPELRPLFGREGEALKEQIVNENMIYISGNRIKSYENRLFSVIFIKIKSSDTPSVEQIGLIADYQTEIIEVLQSSFDNLNREFAYHYLTLINKIRGLKIPMLVKTYFRLLRSAISSTLLPFEGEPLAGLQIMGPLETRALDFDNVIILSVNEGVYPSRSVANTLIPYNLRMGFGLPSYELLDSISAYNFYRLIYRAKRVSLVYDSTTEGLTTGEKSRFILQMAYHYNLDIDEKIVTYPLKKEERRSRPVAKSPEIMDKINNLFNRKFAISPSSLNAYIDCPKRFYYQYVENLKKSDAVKEDIEADVFGTIFHGVMQSIYSGAVGKEVTEEYIKNILDNKNLIKRYVCDYFLSQMNISEITGKNQIIASLIERYAEKVLEYDMSIAPFRYLASEKELKREIIIDGVDGPREVQLKGIADRIDYLNGQYRLIDYKSGSAVISYKSVDELFDSQKSSRAKAALQLLFYIYLSGKKYEECKAVVYSLRRVVVGEENSIEAGDIEIEHFAELLKFTIESIFNPQVDFVAAEDEDACKNCSFKGICG